MTTQKKEILKMTLSVFGCLCVSGLAAYAGTVVGNKISKL